MKDTALAALPPQDDPAFLMGPRGSLIATKHIAPAALMEDQIVKNLIERAREISHLLVKFRADAFDEVDTYMAILAEKFGAQPRKSSNTQLTDFSEHFRVEVSTGTFLSLGPELQAAKSLVDECLGRWSENADDNLRTIVNDAFDVGSEGRVKVDRILALRRVQIHDDTWKRAMEAITEAVRITRSKRYVRFHYRENIDAKWQQIPLDLARV
jgi:hypothetical protein